MKSEVQRIFDAYVKFLEYDPNDYIGKKSITLNWKYDVHRQLMSIDGHIQKDNDHLAIQELSSLSTQVLGLVKSMDDEELLNNFDEFKLAVDLARDVKKIYAEWREGFYKDFLATFSGHDLFDDEELSPDKVDPQFFSDLDGSLEMMKSYIYTTGPGALSEMSAAPMRINKDILIMEDIQQFFAYLKNQDRADDTAYVYFILKVEERTDLSHFIVAITYNGYSILSTDAPSFGTPQNKNSTRNPRRHMESKYDSLGFPYGVIDELDEIRKKVRDVAVFGSYQLDLHKYPIKTLPAYNKLFMIGIADLLKNNAEDIKDTCMLLSDFVNTKLIGEGIDLTEIDDKLFHGHQEKHKQQLGELLSDLNEERGLVKVGAELVVSSEDYDPNWLATPQDLEKLSKWMTLDHERARLQKELDDKFGSRVVEDEAIAKLNSMLNKQENLERLWQYIYAGDKVLFEVHDKVDDPKVSFDAYNHIDKLAVEIFMPRRIRFPKLHLGLDVDAKDLRWKEYREYRTNPWNRPSNMRNVDDFVWRDTCKCCGKYRNDVRKSFALRHWHQIVWILGVSKEEIPEYFRSFRAHAFQSYHGNSIIQEVHPLSQVKHPSWRSFSEGITGVIYVCKRCDTKLNKQYNKGEKMVISNGILRKPDEKDSSLTYLYV